MTIVIGAIDGYDWTRVEHWWKSLKLTGFSGEIHMLTHNISEPALVTMRQVGIVLHPFIPVTYHHVVDRFLYLSEFAATLPDEEWVVFPDVGDIVFQVNPEQYLQQYATEKKIVVASEGVRFEKNLWTRGNLINSFPEHWETMRSQYFYNAGSMAARAGTLRTLAKRVYEMCVRKLDARNHDQAALNILLYTEPEYRDVTLFTSPMDPWCFCAASSLFAKPEDSRHFEGKLPIIRNGKCYTRKGELVCMFHHYTRDIPVRTHVRRWVDMEWRAAH